LQNPYAVICKGALHGGGAMITFFGFAKTVEAGAWLKNHGYRRSMSSPWWIDHISVYLFKILIKIYCNTLNFLLAENTLHHFTEIYLENAQMLGKNVHHLGDSQNFSRYFEC